MRVMTPENRAIVLSVDVMISGIKRGARVLLGSSRFGSLCFARFASAYRKPLSEQ
jgi:hypothetical protein